MLTPAQTKTNSFESRRNTFLPGADALQVYVRAWTLGCFYSLISTQTFRRALTASVDSCAETKRVPLQWRNQFKQSLEEGAGKRALRNVNVSLAQTILPLSGTRTKTSWPQKCANIPFSDMYGYVIIIHATEVYFRIVPPLCASTFVGSLQVQ